MQNKMLFRRHGGFRRNSRNTSNVALWHGYGGPGYGGFGRFGMYGGYRSHYDYIKRYFPRPIAVAAPVYVTPTFITPGTKQFFRWVCCMFIITLTFWATSC